MNSENYEIVRPKLKLGPFFSPKHKLVFDIMKILWNEEEIKILSYFESADKFISLKKLAEKSGIPKNEIKKVLARSVRNGAAIVYYCILQKNIDSKLSPQAIL